MHINHNITVVIEYFYHTFYCYFSDALRTHLKYKHTTEKEIEIPIGTWLSHSPFRLKKIEDKSDVILN